jgi:IS30 family transposase
MLGIYIRNEWIYQYLLDDKRSGGQLYKNLHHSHRKRNKRYGSCKKRGQIPNRVSTDKHPKVVDARMRIGDWEADTIIGRNHNGTTYSAYLSKVNNRASLTYGARGGS